jgi:RecB family exonuclease
LSQEDLATLVEVFDARYGILLNKTKSSSAEKAAEDRVQRLRLHLGIGRWAPDVLENVFAYVGTELRLDAWLNRAQRLIAALPTRESVRSFLGGDESNRSDTPTLEREPPDEQLEKSTMKAPAPVHPAAIAWTTLVIEHLQKVLEAVPAAGSPAELSTSLMRFFEKFEFSKQVSFPLVRASDPTDISEAILDVRGLEALRRAINVSVRSFNYAQAIVGGSSGPAQSAATRIALSALIDEVERSLDSQVLSINPRDRDGLRVLEATDVRGLRFRALFIAGLTEGGFPLRLSGDWLYPHDERERLRKHGVMLEDISTGTLLKEEHYFYQAACRATDRLYLSRPIATDDGSETVASYYLEELKRAISPATITTVSVRADLDKKQSPDSSTASELATLLIRQRERKNREEQTAKSPLETFISEIAERRLISNSALRRVTIEQERNGLWFGQFDGELSNPELKAMVGRHFGAEYVYSASSLSTYGKCPFRFFASRVLKLEPRNEAALDLPQIDAGKLLHEVLRRFFEHHRAEYLPALNAERLREEISEIAGAVFREHELLVPALNERIWKIDCEIRKLILDQVLLFELQLQERSNSRGMRPTFFELAFGRSSRASDPGSRTDHLKFSRQAATGSETILVQGQIDRVDLNHEEKLAIAYDYKLSQGAKLADIEAARETQIPIYLAALEEMFLPGYQLAGGGYYRLRARRGRLNQGLYRHMFQDCTYITAKTICNDVQWSSIREAVRKQLWRFVDGMRAGDFRVHPSLGKQTCKFCDYAAVCRYDTYRISRKARRTRQLATSLSLGGTHPLQ